VNAVTNRSRRNRGNRGQKVSALVYKDRVSGDMHTVELEGIFVQIGLLPNTEWLKGTLELSPRGEIVIDERGQTSLPGVFAAGDATTVPDLPVSPAPRRRRRPVAEPTTTTNRPAARA